MRYLGLALYAEGPTDYYFLKPLLRRVCESLCACQGVVPLEIGDILELDDPVESRDERRAERIATTASASRDAWHILFLHADGSGNPDRVREEQVAPAMRCLEAELGVEYGSVAVIPVRETEAWLLADGDSLRRAFGINRSDQELGIPSLARDVEGIPDPKQVLEAACVMTASRRRGRRKKASAFFELIGELVSIDTLRQIPAFKAMHDELSETLQRLGFISVMLILAFGVTST